MKDRNNVVKILWAFDLVLAFADEFYGGLISADFFQ